MGNIQQDLRTGKGRSKKRAAQLDLSGHEGGGAADWEALRHEDIIFLMVDWVKRGGLASLYTSVDGGAICISLKHDETNNQKLWFHDQEELDDYVTSYQEHRNNGKLPADRFEVG